MRTTVYLITALFLAILPTITFAQSGSLDNTFGVHGTVVTSLGNFGGTCNAVLMQSDGKIVFGGFTKSSFTSSDFAVVRCSNDGTLDTTFGVGGTAITPIESQSQGTSMALQSDGKILLGGSSHWYINVARYNSNGTVDTTFGTGGKVITDIDGYYSERCKSVVIQSDGKILLGGYAQHNSNDHSYVMLVRYNNDGTLDSTFGTHGQVIGNVGKANALSIQSDGKILLAGASNFSFAVVRYNDNGTLDSTFGMEGTVVTAVGSSSEGTALTIQRNGKIVVGGHADSRFAVVRYNSDGTLDSTFGTNGQVIGNKGKANALSIQSDGKILLAGASNSSFAVVRYNENGTLDSTFGIEGTVVTAIGNSSEGNALTIQRDGKIVVGGYSHCRLPRKRTIEK